MTNKKKGTRHGSSNSNSNGSKAAATIQNKKSANETGSISEGTGRITSRSRPGTAMPATSATTATTTAATTRPGILSKGQLTALILLSMGISRLWQLKSFTVRISNSSLDDEVGRSSSSSSNASSDSPQEMTQAASDNKSCLMYYSATACQNDAFVKLLQLKAASAVQVVLVVFVTMIAAWQVPDMLERWNALMVMSPMTTGILALAAALPFLEDAREAKGLFWKEFMVCLVLTVIAMPKSWKTVPFWGRSSAASSQPRRNTIPSVALYVLQLFYLFQVLHMVFGRVEKTEGRKVMDDADSTSPTSWINWTRTTQQWHIAHSNLPQLWNAADENQQQALWKAATPIFLFMLVDRITIALMLALAWHTMDVTRQRTMLLFMTAIYLVEAFVQLPAFDPTNNAPATSIPTANHFALLHGPTWQTLSLSMAMICLVASLAPDLAWIKNHNALPSSAQKIKIR